MFVESIVFDEKLFFSERAHKHTHTHCHTHMHTHTYTRTQTQTHTYIHIFRLVEEGEERIQRELNSRRLYTVYREAN